jgi:beta-glucanase (GH16 family)
LQKALANTKAAKVPSFQFTCATEVGAGQEHRDSAPQDSAIFSLPSFSSPSSSSFFLFQAVQLSHSFIFFVLLTILTMPYVLRDAIGALPWLMLTLSRFANAKCECGYSVNKTTDAQFGLYTEILENDFLHTQNMKDEGWVPQAYNLSRKESRGPYGKVISLANIIPNPLKDDDEWSGEAENGGDAGLQLWVRGDTSHGSISGAEMATVRNDTMYGSYRVAMKLAGVEGTCGAFFWFYNNSQEIDMEFLSKQFNTSVGAVNFVLQSPQSVHDGYDAANTSDFKVHSLPFRPDQEFHEYRFDWSRDKVSFYVDGKWLHDMTGNVPRSAGTLFLNHWSNGDPAWSAGPPKKDTVMTISYVKAYFNSTDEARHEKYEDRCPEYDPKKVCQIPDQKVAPDAKLNGEKAAKTYFFSLERKHTPGQTTYMAGGMSRFGEMSLLTYVPLLVAIVAWIGVV